MNIATTYLGLELSSPLVIGASPFCDQFDSVLRLQDAGASAVVMRSLFEEQLESPVAPPRHPHPSDNEAEFPDFADYQVSPDGYLRQLERLKQTLSIPVIASLNGHRPGGWLHFARQLESAGADAIELNFYRIVTDPSVAADDVETEMVSTVRILSASVQIPVSVKLSPFHTSLSQLAVALELSGSAGTVIFNRFYQPDIDVDTLEPQTLLKLSDPGELLLRLRWLAILSPQLRGTLVATGGIHNWSGVVRSILTGAHAVQLVSAPLKHGPHVVATLRQGLEDWMREHGFTHLEQFRGLLNLKRCPNPAAYERANYVRVMQSWRV